MNSSAARRNERSGVGYGEGKRNQGEPAREDERGRDRIAGDEIDEENPRGLPRGKRRMCIYIYIHIYMCIYLEIP